MREHRCGEDFAAQNSKTMIIGKATEVDFLQVRWPSGKTQKIGKVSANKLLTIYENPDHADTPEGYKVSSYDSVPSSFAKPDRPADFDVKNEYFGDVESDKFRVYVATATWCPSCKKSLPQLAILKEKFGDRVDFYGVPVDRKESKEELAKAITKLLVEYLRQAWPDVKIIIRGNGGCCGWKFL